MPHMPDSATFSAPRRPVPSKEIGREILVLKNRAILRKRSRHPADSTKGTCSRSCNRGATACLPMPHMPDSATFSAPRRPVPSKEIGREILVLKNRAILRKRSRHPADSTKGTCSRSCNQGATACLPMPHMPDSATFSAPRRPVPSKEIGREILVLKNRAILRKRSRHPADSTKGTCSRSCNQGATACLPMPHMPDSATFSAPRRPVPSKEIGREILVLKNRAILRKRSRHPADSTKGTCSRSCNQGATACLPMPHMPDSATFSAPRRPVPSKEIGREILVLKNRAILRKRSRHPADSTKGTCSRSCNQGATACLPMPHMPDSATFSAPRRPVPSKEIGREILVLKNRAILRKRSRHPADSTKGTCSRSCNQGATACLPMPHMPDSATFSAPRRPMPSKEIGREILVLKNRAILRKRSRHPADSTKGTCSRSCNQGATACLPMPHMPDSATFSAPRRPMPSKEIGREILVLKNRAILRKRSRHPADSTKGTCSRSFNQGATASLPMPHMPDSATFSAPRRPVPSKEIGREILVLKNRARLHTIAT